MSKAYQEMTAKLQSIKDLQAITNYISTCENYIFINDLAACKDINFLPESSK